MTKNTEYLYQQTVRNRCQNLQINTPKRKGKHKFNVIETYIVVYLYSIMLGEYSLTFWII